MSFGLPVLAGVCTAFILATRTEWRGPSGSLHAPCSLWVCLTRICVQDQNHLKQLQMEEKINLKLYWVFFPPLANASHPSRLLPAPFLFSASRAPG